ncbi:MAG: ClpXP protease specificity-enhancing factor [Betaproteobacteria bacterium]|nr:ClpXP protease specificity-enhancing factor [Betaproteobacteria bacterium]
MAEISNKPYLVRAIFEWCTDSGLTPYINVRVDQATRVPIEYVKNGEIVLSISQQATRNLTISNDLIQFSARFNGVSREITIPIAAVQSIFARENGRGMFFEPEASVPKAEEAAPPPSLQSVPTSTVTLAAEPATEAADNGDETDDPHKPKGPPRGKLRVIK